MSQRRPFKVLLNRWLQERRAVRARRVRLSLAGYAHLCAMLRAKPCTPLELVTWAELGHVAAYRFLMTLHALKRVHVCAWREKPKAPLQPVFAFGPGTDAAPPKLRSNGRTVANASLPSQVLCPGVVAFEYLLRAIELPASRQEMEASTGMHRDTLQDGLDALVALNLAHIPLWMDRPQGGAPLPQYQLGAGPNAPKPVFDIENRRAVQRQREAHRRTAQRLSAPAFEMRSAAC